MRVVSSKKGNAAPVADAPAVGVSGDVHLPHVPSSDAAAGNAAAREGADRKFWKKHIHNNLAQLNDRHVVSPLSSPVMRHLRGDLTPLSSPVLSRVRMESPSETLLPSSPEMSPKHVNPPVSVTKSYFVMQY
jgi:hypothetical protein